MQIALKKGFALLVKDGEKMKWKADKNCKICKGTGIKWYVCGTDAETGFTEVDKDVCDCVISEGDI